MTPALLRQSLDQLLSELGRYRVTAKTSRPTAELNALDDFFALLADGKDDLLDRL